MEESVMDLNLSGKVAVADLVLLLASDRAGNVTGTGVLIDGGLVKTL
jgi:NAD(P)-dependent dehydrogenase (short-subunit alcohol dehydrogenase family)